MVRKGLFAALVFGLSIAGAAAQEQASGAVARAQLATGVVDREPVDAVTRLGTDTSTVYFFTELHELEGQQVTHRWEHEGEVMAEVSFDVNGPRWRVWSSKALTPEWQGEWRVSVVSADEVLRSESFNYGETEAAADDAVASPDEVSVEDEASADGEAFVGDEALAESDASAADEVSAEGEALAESAEASAEAGVVATDAAQAPDDAPEDDAALMDAPEAVADPE